MLSVQHAKNFFAPGWPDPLVALNDYCANAEGLEAGFAVPTFRDVNERLAIFDAFAVGQAWIANLTGMGQPERLVAARTTAQFFAVFGVPPMLGRTFGFYNFFERRTELWASLSFRAEQFADNRRTNELLYASGRLSGAVPLARAEAYTAAFAGPLTHDDPTFGVVAALLTVVAAVATLIPAVGATRIGPIRALRHE